MKPIDFRGSTTTFTAPPDDPSVLPLRAYRDEHQIVTKWKMTWAERIKALLCGELWCYVQGRALPPMLFTIHDPPIAFAIAVEPEVCSCSNQECPRVGIFVPGTPCDHCGCPMILADELQRQTA